MTRTTATVSTANASKYLQQVCKHWAHNLDVTFDASQGIVRFPREMRDMVFPGEAVITFTATDSELVCKIDASSLEQRDGLKGAVVRHVDRFAFREAPLTYDWVDS